MLSEGCKDTCHPMAVWQFRPPLRLWGASPRDASELTDARSFLNTSLPHNLAVASTLTRGNVLGEL